jgi:hypothetical protein
VAQAYEYEVIQSTSTADFVAALASADADGWEVVGYAIYRPTTVETEQSALLRRRA